MAFNPPLGSTSPEVLVGNATRLDELVNGPPATVPDRAGEPLYTWRLQQQKMEDTLANFQENGGALGFGSLDELLASFNPQLGINKSELEDMLEHIQQFDPTGVGARDLRECLLLQLLS